jgi:hypothetical protein
MSAFVPSFTPEELHLLGATIQQTLIINCPVAYFVPEHEDYDRPAYAVRVRDRDVRNCEEAALSTGKIIDKAKRLLRLLRATAMRVEDVTHEDRCIVVAIYAVYPSHVEDWNSDDAEEDHQMEQEELDLQEALRREAAEATGGVPAA